MVSIQGVTAADLASASGLASLIVFIAVAFAAAVFTGAAVASHCRAFKARKHPVESLTAHTRRRLQQRQRTTWAVTVIGLAGLWYLCTYVSLSDLGQAQPPTRSAVITGTLAAISAVAVHVTRRLLSRPLTTVQLIGPWHRLPARWSTEPTFEGQTLRAVATGTITDPQVRVLFDAIATPHSDLTLGEAVETAYDVLV